MPAALFPVLDPSHEPAWKEERQRGEHTVSLCVWAYASGDVSPEKLERVETFVRDLDQLDARARVLLVEDSKRAGSNTRLYVDHHLEELSADAVRAIFHRPAAEVGAETFCSALRLLTVAIRPGREHAVFDYSIGPELTNYVLAVTIPAGAGEWDIQMES